MFKVRKDFDAQQGKYQGRSDFGTAKAVPYRAWQGTPSGVPEKQP